MPVQLCDNRNREMCQQEHLDRAFSYTETQFKCSGRKEEDDNQAVGLTPY